MLLTQTSYFGAQVDCLSLVLSSILSPKSGKDSSSGYAGSNPGFSGSRRVAPSGGYGTRLASGSVGRADPFPARLFPRTH
ncbi:hypothetical protein FsymDg_3864 [Candidatus Protofrankia datiscae]|uniref:Uncharacterized protein n=1 Tax=Candidatus Protofrankia datiscae TaxID=2716812 RepID=F8AVP9_9ACTN|nr:hypothetical protein FsymDg_3864 [Candidatus Protofrankia datiscae]